MMNTNFAQIMVSNLKVSSTKFKVGFLSLIFTFVFLGMGTTSHAQTLKTSNTKIDVSVLDNYSFKVDRGDVISTLMAFKETIPSQQQDERYHNLATRYAGTFYKALANNPTLEIRKAAEFATHDLYGFAERFAGNSKPTITKVVTDVANLIH